MSVRTLPSLPSTDSRASPDALRVNRSDTAPPWGRKPSGRTFVRVPRSNLPQTCADPAPPARRLDGQRFLRTWPGASAHRAKHQSASGESGCCLAWKPALGSARPRLVQPGERRSAWATAPRPTRVAPRMKEALPPQPGAPHHSRHSGVNTRTRSRRRCSLASEAAKRGCQLPMLVSSDVPHGARVDRPRRCPSGPTAAARRTRRGGGTRTTAAPAASPRATPRRRTGRRRA